MHARVSMKELIRRRWASVRPFEGTSEEALKRKLAFEALQAWVEMLILRELEWRKQGI